MHNVFCPVTVGREDELAVLEQRLEPARAGRGSTVVISGEPGIGKSRLATEAEKLARNAGMAVLRGRAVEGSERLPYRPLGEAIQSTLRTRGLPDARDLAPFRSALGVVVPEWADPAPAPEAPTVLPEAVLRLLRVLAAEEGLLLVLEDMHWADEQMVGMLGLLAARSRGGLTIVATARPTRTGSSKSSVGGLPVAM